MVDSMNRLILLALLVPGLALAETSKADLGRAPNMKTEMGVYKRQFNNAMVDGTKYRSEDVLELVKVSDKTAYFRLHMDFANGHMCNLFGMATLEADALTYRGKMFADSAPCTLKIRRRKDGIGFEDVDGQCRNESCGARGAYGDGSFTSFPAKSLRPIRYMKRLLASKEYAAAKLQFETGKPQFGE